MELEWMENRIGNGEGEKNEGREKNEDGEKAEKKQEKCRIDSKKLENAVKSEIETGSLLGKCAQNSKQIFENLTWLTSNEAAEYLRLPSVGALRVLVCKRRLPFHKLGRSLRFKRAELDRLLDASKHLGGL